MFYTAVVGFSLSRPCGAAKRPLPAKRTISKVETVLAAHLAAPEAVSRGLCKRRLPPQRQSCAGGILQCVRHTASPLMAPGRASPLSIKYTVFNSVLYRALHLRACQRIPACSRHRPMHGICGW